MFRIYFANKTAYGLEVQGPNGHRWVCKPDESWSRATGFAKALERAYLEGQKSIAEDVDIAVGLDALSELGVDTGSLSEVQLRREVVALSERTQRARRRLDKIRELTKQMQISYKEKSKDADAGEASSQDNIHKTGGPE